MIRNVLPVILISTVLYAFPFDYNSVHKDYNEDWQHNNRVYRLVKKWAPVVLLAPGEMFLPSSVPYFLQHVVASSPNESSISMPRLPIGKVSEMYHLVTKQPVEELLKNTSSFLYGQDPQKEKVPVYAIVSICNRSLVWNNLLTNSIDTIASNTYMFHVTYWFFYPFNEGKNICTLSLGFLGSLPIPKMFNKCLGQQQPVGSHVGDWEHMSLLFRQDGSPDRMYVSTHDAGVYYKYNSKMAMFAYESQETRTGILQNPKFPSQVNLVQGHPVLYSARGSHGLWSQPGTHRFVTVPRFYDDTGIGVPWKTWDSLEIIESFRIDQYSWLKYRGRWGNMKSLCHPLKRVGINICQLTDGPTGIPMKRLNFECPKNV